jgi:uncharacterized membrane protein
MFLFYFSISLVIASTALYHIFQKATSKTVNPLLALTVTFGLAAVLCFVLSPLYPQAGRLTDSIRQLNWASFALAFAVVGIDTGFLLAYRAGWNISIGAIVSNATVTLVLLPIGLLFFREKLSLVNILGIAACIIGLVMINRK